MTCGPPIKRTNVNIEFHRQSRRIQYINNFLHRRVRQLASVAGPREAVDYDLAVEQFDGEMAYAAAGSFDDPLN